MLKQPSIFLLLAWFLLQQCLLTLGYAGDNIHDGGRQYNRPLGIPTKKANDTAPINNWIRALPLLHQGLYFGKRVQANEYNDINDDEDKEFRDSTLGHTTSKRNPRLSEFMMGKRDPRLSEFMMGKRDPRLSSFMLGKRDPRLSEFMMGKRDPRLGDFMLGKRDPRLSEFMMGKRDPRLSEFMMGKRDPRLSEFMMGKRDPRLSEFMMGKRDPRLSELMLGKRDSRLSDFMMDKRDPRLSEFMMGKRDPRLSEFMMGKKDPRWSDFVMVDEDETGKQTGNKYFEKEVEHLSNRYVLNGEDVGRIDGNNGRPNVIYDDTDIPNQAEASEIQDLESSPSLKRKSKLYRPSYGGQGKTPSVLWNNLGGGKRSSSIDYEDEEENVQTNEIKRSADPNPKTSVRRFPPAALHKGLYFGKRAANWADM